MDDGLRQACADADEVARGSTWLWSVGHELAKRWTEGGRSMTKTEVALARALQVTVDSGRADSGGRGYRGWWLDGDPEESELADWLRTWDAAADVAEHPAVRAHLCDLLWIERHGHRPHERAMAAIDSYLQAWGDSWEHFDLSRNLLRAVDLARELRNGEARARTERELVAAVTAALNGGDVGTAVLLLTHGTTASFLPEHQEQVQDLLEQAVERATSPEHVERLVKAALAKTRDEAADQTLRDRAVAAHRLAAHEAEEPFLRLLRLRDAARVAEELGHPAHDEIIHQIEETDASEGFKRLRHDFTVPRSVSSDVAASIVGADTLIDALRRFGEQLPVSPSSIDRLRSTMPIGLRHTVTSFRFGEANSVISSSEAGAGTSTEERIAEAHERDVLNMAGWQAQLLSFMCLVPALHQALAAYEPWTVPEVAEELRAGWVDAASADALARSLDHFAHRRYDEAGHVALPRVERLLRTLARKCGVLTTRRPTARVGGIRGMGEILSDLRGEGEAPVLPEPLLTATDLLLVNGDSLNLRNNILHGINEEADAAAAALILQIAMALTLGLTLEAQAPAPSAP